MKADGFYQTDGANAWPLILLNQGASLNELSETIRNALVAQQFKGALGDVAVIMNAAGLPLNVYIGAGDGNETLAIASAVTKIPAGVYQTPHGLAQSALLAWSLAQYKFDHYKKSGAQPRVLAVDEHALPDVLLESSAIFLVRDLINMPANAFGPSEMAERVAILSMEHGAVFQQWTGDELLRDHFPAIHAVGRAAADAPRLLSLTWGDETHPRVTLVGKGVCFDSGGLDIKPAAGMRFMKKDMGGAAHVIGLAHWIMAKRLPIRLQVLIPAVENAVGSRAFRPGDVLTMRNGLTVEIDNTDAEGRLVLADAIVKACEDKPELLIDFATLTGAARVAVGTEIAAMFTNDDELADAVAKSAGEANDPVWRMPLFAGYASMLDSSIADMANSSPSAYAGAITAALFLQRFVKEPMPWLHFDVMAWNVSNKPGRPEGGEAMGMLAVGRYLIGRYGSPL
ncbi:MAG TPA: leucyl aminopeptidase [Legionella sp.]|nr:leucyl aminopeptidase [Legionella sp.]